MKIYAISDIHFRQWAIEGVAPPKIEVDKIRWIDDPVFLLLGDIFDGLRTPNATEPNSPGRQLIRKLCVLGRVIFVPGNHEFWGANTEDFFGYVSQFKDMVRSDLENRGISRSRFDVSDDGQAWLFQDSTLVFAATLWPRMKDFHIISTPNDLNQIANLTPSRWEHILNQEADIVKNNLIHTISRVGKNQTRFTRLVVATHFPTMRHETRSSTPYFSPCEDRELMDLFFELGELCGNDITFAFGHTHSPCNFTQDFGGAHVKVVSNPVGYSFDSHGKLSFPFVEV